VRLHLVEQRTEAWKQLRAGKLTGSVAKDMLVKIKTGEAAARRDLKFRLLAERLSGQPQESGYVNAAMEWGTAHEAEAIAAYEALTGALVQPVGFCEHEELWAGTSPDGFVGEDGILSIKCPKTATQIAYLRAGTEPAEHWAQNTHELWLTGRVWVDFVSFDPRLPEGLRLFLVRVTRTPAELAAYDTEARKFLAELQTEYDALRTMTTLTDVLKEAVA
jgi:hypothetical protein